MSNQKDNKIMCPVSKFTEMLGGKWKLIIVDNIRKRGTVRFGQLAASIPGISRKVISSGLVKKSQLNLISDLLNY